MGNKRKREDDEEDYDQFCQGLGEDCSRGIEHNSFVYSSDHRVKRQKINPNFYPVKYGSAPDVAYTELNWTDKEYIVIENLINNPSFVIDSMVRVDNALLQQAYSIKREEKLQLFQNPEEAFLFHGTKESNVESICRYNFDWRLYGRNVGHKFGKGVNFSANAKYASSYSCPHSYTKVMIVAKVLIGNICPGRHDMSIPPPGYDTTQKGRDGVVVVKYDDNEFYPAYVVYYHFRGRDRRDRHPYDRHNYNYSHCSLNHNTRDGFNSYNHQYEYHYGNWRYGKYYEHYNYRNKYDSGRYGNQYDSAGHYSNNYNYYNAHYDFRRCNKTY